ncbi:hypothetical protein CY34DRAFT_803071 [Suillus luteus UH-Slu-Lm8-n1]|uniref:Uncharacterized protein n=1 Tax=Suillus luteus UH-Slu-Lm8-n1 TaxID=930992 RepID=A0A0D0AQQ9_9AGAM|nr:hypothetical protein CY34DRAFT_803071 [Suillus luteus UH-Slu-Lm8-n1]
MFGDRLREVRVNTILPRVSAYASPASSIVQFAKNSGRSSDTITVALSINLIKVYSTFVMRPACHGMMSFRG